MSCDEQDLNRSSMHIERLEAAESDSGQRLDHFVSLRAPALSRSQAKRLILDGLVTVNGKPAKPSKTVWSGDEVVVQVPAPKEQELAAEPIPLDVIYEDGDLLVVNKPAGLVVHPAPGSPGGTLVNAILHHCGGELAISGTRRPGIVHRLDKDTSGLLVVAKSDTSFRSLSKQVKERSVERTYLAVVSGSFEELQGKIDAPIGRSIRDRKRMAVTGVRGRTAVTHFRVTETFRGASLVDVKLETGRTHQIRVHFAFIGHPILGDAQYGHGVTATSVFSRSVLAAIKSLRGQALHASSLGFTHPTTGEWMQFEAPVRDDLARLLAALRQGESAV